MRQHVTQAQEHALHVDPDHGVEHRLVIVRGGRKLAFDAGIVEEAVDAAVFVDRGLHIGLHLVRLGNVGCHRESVAAALADDARRGLGRRAVAVHHYDFGAMPGEARRRCAADAVAAAGD